MEPEGRSPHRRFRPWIALLAATAATIGVLVAPADWPAGQGTLRVELGGVAALDAVVSVGSEEAIELRNESGARALELETPGRPTY